VWSSAASAQVCSSPRAPGSCRRSSETSLRLRLEADGRDDAGAAARDPDAARSRRRAHEKATPEARAKLTWKDLDRPVSEQLEKIRRLGPDATGRIVAELDGTRLVPRRRRRNRAASGAAARAVRVAAHLASDRCDRERRRMRRARPGSPPRRPRWRWRSGRGSGGPEGGRRDMVDNVQGRARGFPGGRARRLGRPGPGSGRDGFDDVHARGDELDGDAEPHALDECSAGRREPFGDTREG
jgi:hypothetical protein